MTAWDPYLDLTHGVLRNRLGITDPVELAAAEADLAALAMAELELAPLTGDYDLEHLRGFHRFIFGDVYGWAGELRTVSIGKGQLFCPPERIPAEAAEIFGWLADDDYLRGLGREEFLDGLTELLADINGLHPFREGNGRTQRAFCGQLAREAGYRVRWAGLDRTENVTAAKFAHEGDNAPLRALLDPLIVPLEW
ncbi:Fic family protein [Pseudonocardia eucalypti]|uniref:protein adenylyltransferase n=1 Tax=Pseudonocardia eucalypti TaxID=648755 RepID=A0ABP9RDD7_9PSEU|nr:cell filamentation protein [Pseudonocardia eucalypti]